MVNFEFSSRTKHNKINKKKSSTKYDNNFLLPGFEHCYEAVTVTLLLKLCKGCKNIKGYTFSTVLGENDLFWEETGLLAAKNANDWFCECVVVNVYIFQPMFRSLTYSRQILQRGSFSCSITLLLFERKKPPKKGTNIFMSF